MNGVGPWPWNISAANTVAPLGCFCVVTGIGPTTGRPFLGDTNVQTPRQGGRGSAVSMKLAPVNWSGLGSNRYRSLPAYVTWSAPMSFRYTIPSRCCFTPTPATGLPTVVNAGQSAALSVSLPVQESVMFCTAMPFVVQPLGVLRSNWYSVSPTSGPDPTTRPWP